MISNILISWDFSELQAIEGELSDAVRSSVEDVQPARKVTGGGRSVISKIPSRDYDHMLEAESRTYEMPLIYLLLMDPRVELIRTQPHVFRLPLKNKNGRTVRTPYCPDVFVRIAGGASVFFECKPRSELERKTQRYRKLQNGLWEDIVAAEYLRAHGTYFLIFEDSNVTEVLLRNIAYLKPFLRSRSLLDHRIVDLVFGAVVGFGLSRFTESDLSERLNELELEEIRRSLFYLIGNGYIFTRLDLQEIDAETTLFFSDSATCASWNFYTGKNLIIEPGKCFESDGNELIVQNRAGIGKWLIRRSGHLETIDQSTLVELIQLEGWVEIKSEPIDVLLERNGLKIKKNSLAIATKRMQRLRDHEQGRAKLPGSTLTRFRLCSKRGIEIFGCEVYGFLPKGDQGNRTDGYNKADREFLEYYVRAKFLGVQKPQTRLDICPARQSKNVSQAHALYKREALKKGLEFYGVKTFRKLIKETSYAEIERAERGYKAANGAKGAVWGKTKISSTAYYPGEILEIDDSRGDIQLKDQDLGEIGRVTVSAATDQFSRLCTALEYSSAGSTVALLARVLKAHVRNHGYLPSVVYTDKGPNFTSDYHSDFCRELGIELRHRPTGDSRFGAVVERFFETLNIDYLHNTNGSTRLMKNPRVLSKGFRANEKSSWTLEMFDEELEKYRKFYNNLPHSGLRGRSPSSVFVSKRRELVKEQLHLQDDNSAISALLCPWVEGNGTRKVNKNVITNKGLAYTCNALEAPELQGKKIRVRWDPNDMSYVLAYIGGVPLKALSRTLSGNYSYAELKRISVMLMTRGYINRVKNRRLEAVAEMLENSPIKVQEEDKRIKRMEEERRIRSTSKKCERELSFPENINCSEETLEEMYA